MLSLYEFYKEWVTRSLEEDKGDPLDWLRYVFQGGVSGSFKYHDDKIHEIQMKILDPFSPQMRIALFENDQELNFEMWFKNTVKQRSFSGLQIEERMFGVLREQLFLNYLASDSGRKSSYYSKITELTHPYYGVCHAFRKWALIWLQAYFERCPQEISFFCFTKIKGKECCLIRLREGYIRLSWDGIERLGGKCEEVIFYRDKYQGVKAHWNLVKCHLEDPECPSDEMMVILLDDHTHLYLHLNPWDYVTSQVKCSISDVCRPKFLNRL